MPLLPQLTFWLKNTTGHGNQMPYNSALRHESSPGKPVPSDNRLVIPQMDLDNQVFEGRSASTLSKGIWHRPQTSTPDAGGNTVLVAHRFTYKSPAIFYHLDVMKKGDKFALFWDGKEYDYQVREVRTVEPAAIGIEKNTTDPILTLYTCTPIWTAEKRLVVISTLIEDTPS